MVISMRTVNSDQHSLAWLLISAIGGALAAIVVAGVIAGRLGLPINGSWLLGAGVIGALPRTLAIIRRRWAVRWAELAAVLVGFAAIGGVGLALAWPALLPLGFSVDAVHHTQLIAWMADHSALPSPGGSTQGLLGEMTAYPIGLALLVLAAASGTGRPLLEATYPMVALLGGLIAAVVVLLSSAAASGELRIENKELRNPFSRGIFNSQFSILNFLALLVGPLLLLAHRTYLMEAYIDHSYYTMVLGVLLVLLAVAWLIVEPPRSLGSAVQLGLVLAALMGTYPLWAPLPAALVFIAILNHSSHRQWTTDDGRWQVSSIVHRLLSMAAKSMPWFMLAFGPALALALLDVLPRMRIGQAVLTHEGLVTLPNPQRLMPILLALPGALLVARGRAGRNLVGLAALVALAIGALAISARGGMAAGYHSYKLLFVLTPLAAAIVGAALARLVAVQEIAPEPEAGSHSVAAATPLSRRNGRTARGAGLQQLNGFARLYSHEILASTGSWLLWFNLRSQNYGSGAVMAQMPTDRHSQNWTRTTPLQGRSADEHGQMSVVGRRLSVVDSHFHWLALAAATAVLALTGSFQIIPMPSAQVITPDIVAATRWLRANAPKDAARAISVGVPAGPLSYWIEVGLLGQRRDKAAAAQRDFTIAPPVRESWLIDQQLAPVAITTAANLALPGESILARFGDVTIIRRTAQPDPTPLNPLLIRYRSFWEDQRLKTAIELQRALSGPLPLLDLRLYHAGAPIATFALPPEQDRIRTQYLGVDLLPATLGAEGYINQSAYPIFAAPALAPTGALSLTLRLTLAGAVIEERPLASFERAADGQMMHLAPSSGELIYLRHDPATAAMHVVDLDFGGALRLTGWDAPAHAAAGDPSMIGLRWEAPRALNRALFPELQILNASGQPVATNLAAPQDGFYPTWRWRPGESVTEQRRIQLPPDLTPGVYQVAMRVHDFAAGHALDVHGSADGLARIGEIVVEQGE
jgi:hypothetical protein